MKIVFFKEGKTMLTKKKKMFILFGMVALLVITGGLNLFLSSQSESVTTTTTTSTSLLTTYRTSKYDARQQMLAIYESIIETSTDEEEIAQTKALLSELAGRIEQETVLEGLIMTSGYEDCVVSSSEDGSYSIVVKSNGFTSDDAATILSILVRETGVSATNVKIYSV